MFVKKRFENVNEAHLAYDYSRFRLMGPMDNRGKS